MRTSGGPTMIQFALGNNPAGLNSPFSPGLNTPTPLGSQKPPGSELTTDGFSVRDAPFEWNLVGNCAFVGRFDYSG